MHTLVEPPVEPADLHQAPTVQLNSSSNHIHHALADDPEPQRGPIGPSMPPAADSEVAATSDVDPTGPSAYDDDANEPTLGRTHCQTSTSTTVQRLACIRSFVAANCSLQPACVPVQCVFRPKKLHQDEHVCCCYHWLSSVP